jgi:hypothetical protein
VVSGDPSGEVTNGKEMLVEVGVGLSSVQFGLVCEETAFRNGVKRFRLE